MVFQRSPSVRRRHRLRIRVLFEAQDEVRVNRRRSVEFAVQALVVFVVVVVILVQETGFVVDLFIIVGLQLFVIVVVKVRLRVDLLAPLSP